MALQERNGLQVSLGFASETGKRPDNQDFVAALVGGRAQIAARGIVAAVADGVGGHQGGRQASELAIRSFLEAWSTLPETLGVRRTAARALEPVNAWLHALGRTSPELEGMATTFTALVLLRRRGHVVHVGDSRLYRLSDSGLECLTTDHVMGRGDLSHVLTRALGLEDVVRFDHAEFPLRLHDRFLLCSDGVHGTLRDRQIRQLLEDRAAPEETARAIADAAFAAGSTDNITAMVMDVIDLPPADETEISGLVAALPILDPPVAGESVDGFALAGVLSDGHYSRLFRAMDTLSGQELVLKFPKPKVAVEATYRLAFVREAWVAARVRSPWIGGIVEVAPERQTRLYSVMPFYDGETLEKRLKRSKIGLEEGVSLATRLARAIVTLHRAGIIHRDIKPDNVILETSGGLRLVDLGVARVPQLEDFPAEDIPGTPSFMAPELFGGAAGDEASDQYALGVTIYRMLSGAYPYGEVEPFTRPRFTRPAPLSRYRPDLPAWLDAVLARAVAVKSADRFGDVIELAQHLENGARVAGPVSRRGTPLYARNPLRFWQIVSGLLAMALVWALARR